MDHAHLGWEQKLGIQGEQARNEVRGHTLGRAESSTWCHTCSLQQMELVRGSPLPMQERKCLCWKESVTPRRSSHQSAASRKKTLEIRPGASWKGKVFEVAYAKTTRNTLFSRLEIKLVSRSLLTFNKPVHDFKAKARKMKDVTRSLNSQAATALLREPGFVKVLASHNLYRRHLLEGTLQLPPSDAYIADKCSSWLRGDLLVKYPSHFFERISKAWDVEWGQQKKGPTRWPQGWAEVTHMITRYNASYIK